MKILVFNKILLDTLPIEKVCDVNKIHWITALLRTRDEYEDQFYIFIKR